MIPRSEAETDLAVPHTWIEGPEAELAKARNEMRGLLAELGVME